MSTQHELKTWPGEFGSMRMGFKTFELRKDDRNFQVGDTILSREFQPCKRCNGTGLEAVAAMCSVCHPSAGGGPDNPLRGKYTKRKELFEITYKLPGGRFGLPANLCILSVRSVVEK